MIYNTPVALYPVERVATRDSYVLIGKLGPELPAYSLKTTFFDSKYGELGALISEGRVSLYVPFRKTNNVHPYANQPSLIEAMLKKLPPKGLEEEELNRSSIRHILRSYPAGLEGRRILFDKLFNVHFPR